MYCLQQQPIIYNGFAKKQVFEWILNSLVQAKMPSSSSIQARELTILP